MKYEVKFNLKGNLPVPRAVSVLVNQGILTINDLGWYLMFVMQSDFGHKYQTYGLITKSDKIIASEVNCSQSTVFKMRKRLIKAGVLRKEGRETAVANFALFENKDKTIVPIISEAVKNDDKKTMAEYFVNQEKFLKNQQEFIEKRKSKYLGNP